jgi:hypothetical protein
MLHRAQAPTIAGRPRRRRWFPPLGLRVRVWASSLQLDCRLAEGVQSTSSPELTLRAQQLASGRSRHQLSNALTAAVDAASCPRRPWRPAPPIDATGVLEAAEPLQRLADDLTKMSDPPVRALALVSFLVCDPTSPLYNRHSPVTVREIAQRARSALAAPRPWAAHHLSTEPDAGLPTKQPLGHPSQN